MIKRFSEFVRENIDIVSTMGDEHEAVANFDWSPYSVEILTCHGDIDETSGHVTIKLTNGDQIAYHARLGGKVQGPSVLEINHKDVGPDERTILWEEYLGSTGSLVADILLWYKQRILAKSV